MKKIIIAAVLLGVAIFFCGYSNYQDDPGDLTGTLSRLDDLDNPMYRVAVPMGGQAMRAGEAQFTKARLCYFRNPDIAFQSIVQRKVDGFLFNSHSADYQASQYPDITVLPGCMDRVKIVMALPKRNADMRSEINRFINLCRQDGTYKDMYQRWFKSSRLGGMPYIETPKSPKRHLVVGTCSQVRPLCFLVGEELRGFDIEYAQRLAAYLNASITFLDMNYHDLKEAVRQGKVDLAIAGINADENQDPDIVFSKDYIDSYVVAAVSTELVRKKPHTRKNR